jgi:anti-sigma-K factor RskA
MNWYRHPETVDRLAAEYVMGHMTPPVKRRFERVMAQRTDVALAVDHWAELTLPMLMRLPEQTPSPALWDAIEQRTHLQPTHTASAKTLPTPWWRRWLAPIPAGALAMGLTLGAALPLVIQLYQAQQADMQLPESYVGVLATQQGKPGLIVSSLRHGKVVDFKVVTPVSVPAGHVLYLWRIDKAGVAAPLGAVPATGGKILHVPLQEPAEKAFFAAVELAVSIEQAGVVPATPTQPYVYRGLCGKVWK